MTSQALGIFFAIILFFAAGIITVFAEETGVTATSGAKKTIEYHMAYPGLLPDSPFYFLKMARDRVVSFLISDPLKRAEFDLLQADKRVLGGVHLLNKDRTKANLALATASKGQQYMKKALTDNVEAKKYGNDTSIFSAKLYLASQKQEEVLTAVASRIPQEEASYYLSIMKEQDSLINKAKTLSQQDQKKKR